MLPRLPWDDTSKGGSQVHATAGSLRMPPEVRWPVIATEHSRALTSTTITSAPARPSGLATSGVPSRQAAGHRGRPGRRCEDRRPAPSPRTAMRPPGGAQGPSVATPSSYPAERAPA